MSGSKWTEEETKLLKQNINKPIKDILKVLPYRTKDGIQKKKLYIDAVSNDWTDYELSVLEKRYSDTEIEKLMDLLPARTKTAILNKAARLNIKKEKISKDTIDDLLSILKKIKLPASDSELIHVLNISKIKLLKNIKELERLGYDIKKITHGNRTHYILARYGNLDAGKVYKEVGSVNTPVIISSDWHIGSKGFSEIAFNQLVEDVKKYKIKDILVAGDVIQGKGVHSREALDLLVMDIDDQVDLAVQYMNMFPKDVTIHLVHGGHEEHLMGSVRVGYNALRHVASRINNCNYYGYGARLSLNDKYSLLMMHTSGALPYASSYKAERVDASLIERADVSVFGHRHQLFTIAKPPNRLLIEGGTLQRENSFIVWKGGASQVGWVILKEYDSETSNLIFHRPMIY